MWIKYISQIWKHNFSLIIKNVYTYIFVCIDILVVSFMVSPGLLPILVLPEDVKKWNHNHSWTWLEGFLRTGKRIEVCKVWESPIRASEVRKSKCKRKRSLLHTLSFLLFAIEMPFLGQNVCLSHSVIPNFVHLLNGLQMVHHHNTRDPKRLVISSKRLTLQIVNGLKAVTKGLRALSIKFENFEN